MIRILMTALTVFVFAAAAQAQSRDVYTVRGIPVDEQASSVIEAQQQAFNAAKFAGAQEMIARITLPEDRLAARNRITLTPDLADRLAIAVDVEEEVRGAGRYRGQLAVVFNPSSVRSLLSEAGLPYTDQQGPRALLVPISRDPRTEFVWAESWPETSEGRLVPTVTIYGGVYGLDTPWDFFAGDLAATNTRRVIFADLSGVPNAYRVTLTTVTAGGAEEIGTTNAMSSLEAARMAAGDLLDLDWKRSAIVRDDGTRTLIRASVLYTSLAEWNTLRGALLRSPFVSNFRTEAVARQGAIVEFAYAGSDQRFANDLRQRGVQLQMEPIGWVITSAVSGRP
ncbi:MAG: DUF2066 domain-containing protein [Pseudomonadota bacterium]